MKRALQPNLKVVASYVDQLRSNFDERMQAKPTTSTASRSSVESATSSLALPVSHSEFKSIHELKECVRDHALGSKFSNGIATWSRFSALNDIMKGFRLGELSIITGPTGSGKTTFLSEYSMDLCLAGVSTVWCSLEVPTGKLASWMMSQYAKTDLTLLPEEQAKEKFDEIFAKMQTELKHMYFFDQHGSVPVDNILQAVERLHSVQKLDHILVDNLQFMQGSDKHGSQFDKFMRQDLIFAELRQLATKLNIHVTLVVHPRKEFCGTDLDPNSLYGGVKASQEADNIFIIQKMAKQSADPSFTKYFQVHKNRSAGELVLGYTLRMDFDSRTKCHTLRKVAHQSRSYESNWSNNSRYGGRWMNNNGVKGDWSNRSDF